MTIDGDIILEARGISKAFPGVQALDEVSLSLRRGRLTALLGENGAGKSTLMNIIAGVFAADSGEIRLAGEPVNFASPREAQAAGIAMIYQELNLVADLNVAENIFLGREPLNPLGFIDAGRMNREAAKLLERLELAVRPGTPLARLRIGQQQVVEIAKALSTDSRVLIMDEPTSAITEHEIDVLFDIVTRLKQDGVAIAYITHKLEELNRIGDDAVVMRDGKLIAAGALSDFNRDDIVRMMVGRDMRVAAPRIGATQGTEALRVDRLSLASPDRPGGYLLKDIDLVACEGEVLGVFGLMGAGRTELLETLFGLHGAPTADGYRVAGEAVSIRSPVDAIDHGLAMAPEDRKREGLVLGMSVSDNASLASLDRCHHFGFIDAKAESHMVAESVERFRVRTPSLQQLVRNLSGGNQQKVILAKWLATRPRILLLDEPTRGIDVGAKEEIYALIHELSAGGLAVIVVSSELPEILALSDRIMVMCEGRKTAEFRRDEADSEVLMQAALPATSSLAGREAASA